MSGTELRRQYNYVIVKVLNENLISLVEDIMSEEIQISVAEMKAERKRLSTARGLLTRERNKLARESEQLQDACVGD